MPSQSKDDHSLHSQQQRVGYQYSKETPRKIVTILHFRVPLLQSSKPDTTFQFGQVMDVHMFAISPLSLFANNDYFPNGYSPVYNTTWMRLSPPYWLLMITSPMDVHLFAIPPEWGPPTPPNSYEWLLPQWMFTCFAIPPEFLQVLDRTFGWEVNFFRATVLQYFNVSQTKINTHPPTMIVSSHLKVWMCHGLCCAL